jgi:hypothetical protein
LPSDEQTQSRVEFSTDRRLPRRARKLAGKGLQTVSELRAQYEAALDEYTGKCTVIITSENPSVPHGSGVAVRYGDDEYIVTAAHVLEPEPDDSKIRIIGHGDTPLLMLRGKNELLKAIESKTVVPKFSAATPVKVMGRFVARTDDIAALKITQLSASLPHTRLHNLSDQPEVAVTTGTPVTIFGFPGELARPYENKTSGKRGLAAFPHITGQSVVDISCAPDKIDQKVNFLTDFDYPEEDQCDPHGMSGCGGWSFPPFQDGKIWSAQQTTLLGIEIGQYRTRNVLQFVRIERVLQLLSTGK